MVLSRLSRTFDVGIEIVTIFSILLLFEQVETYDLVPNGGPKIFCLLDLCPLIEIVKLENAIVA